MGPGRQAGPRVPGTISVPLFFLLRVEAVQLKPRTHMFYGVTIIGILRKLNDSGMTGKGGRWPPALAVYCVEKLGTLDETGVSKIIQMCNRRTFRSEHFSACFVKQTFCYSESRLALVVWNVLCNGKKCPKRGSHIHVSRPGEWVGGCVGASFPAWSSFYNSR
mgnify:CR=1 FL=1